MGVIIPEVGVEIPEVGVKIPEHLCECVELEDCWESLCHVRIVSEVVVKACEVGVKIPEVGVKSQNICVNVMNWKNVGKTCVMCE